MNRVQRRILVDEHTEWHHGFGLDHLKDVTLAGDEIVHIAQREFHIGEPAQCPEVEVLVVIHRRLVPQPFVGGIRVGVDRDVVGVIGESTVVRFAHCAPGR